MTKLTNKELSVLVGNAMARAEKSGKSANATQRAVLTRLSNAAKIDEAIAALYAAEGK